jgi:hypothetical protein
VANAAIEGITIRVAGRVTSLGTGLGAGRRRNMTQAVKRLSSRKQRRNRSKMLKRAGVKTDRIVRTGGVAYITFGQKSLGVSDSLLLQQRRSVAAACCASSGGANLDLSLALADGQSRGAADPAFEAHCGVVQFWALAIWEQWVPLQLLDKLVRFSIDRLGGAMSRWSLVYGPAAAFTATLWRLGWSVVSAAVCTDDLGEAVDLRMHSPEWVAEHVYSSVCRWRWRKVEHAHPTLNSAGAGLGPAWRPIVGALKAKDTTDWGQLRRVR